VANKFKISAAAGPNQAPDEHGFNDVEELVSYLNNHQNFGAFRNKKPDNLGFRLVGRFVNSYIPGP